MRRWPPPLRVTLPPPARTTSGLAMLWTFAVSVIVIVTGLGPQLKVMMPPRATADTTASEVQLAGVPLPMTRVGCEVSAAPAGTTAVPSGLPGPTTQAVAVAATAIDTNRTSADLDRFTPRSSASAGFSLTDG